ncbi:hypothetical protein HWV62_44135 [Athelia sp. TMB]|nr:hypothetical protein HWV62_44135 [Athelia sp. TMB]
MCITFAYTGVLAAFAAFGPLNYASHHLTLLLAVTFGIYIYRDVYPLGTFDKLPMDLSEGNLLWPMICLLGVTGVVIPLVTPRTYTPFDPDTASPLGLALWTFLDPIILLANRVSHLAFDQLPPLADSDEAKNLAKKAFPILDPFTTKKKRHIFWGFLSLYRYSYIEQCIWMRMSAHTESIITQLVFEHALRIRMKTEASESLETTNENTPTSSTPDIPDSASIADSSPADSTTVSTAGTATSSRKGKQKAQSEDAESAPSAEGKHTSQRSSENLIGKINNLVSTDLGNITDGRNWLWLALYMPLQIALCVTFLYRTLGWSSFVGIAIIVICLPIPGYVSKQMQSSQKKKMQATDDRIQRITETLGVLRMVKLFGWEGKMNEQLRNTRDEELHWTRKIRVFTIISMNIYFFMPAGLFSASSADTFNILREQMLAGFQFLPACIQGQVSLDRLNTFLNDTERLDAYAEGSNLPDAETTGMEPEDDEIIGFLDATFSWSGSSPDGMVTPSRRQFLLQLDGKVLFKRNTFNMVIGPTGSGKTSLLMALLGEMHFIRTGPTSWFNLPREGGIAYAAQESWVQNDTIKLFDAGDETEVGEKGLTLRVIACFSSQLAYGEKKARVTLARAVYSSAKILLLDDVLAALDVHTSKWIVDKCFLGDLIKGRTVILVTHNIAMVGPIAQFVLSLGTDGRIVSQGTISEALMHDEALAKEEASETEITAKADTEIDPDIEKTKPDGTLIVAENIAEGRITWATLKIFFLKTGGEHPFIFWAVYLGLAFSDSLANNFGPWWLGVWASQYEIWHSSEVSVSYYLVVYTGGLLLNAALYTATSSVWIYGSLCLARMMHQELVDAVLGTTLRAVLPVKREMNNSRSPILAHFGAAMDGLVSIRAYGAQLANRVESMTRIDKYTRTARTFHNLACWISLRIEVLSAALTAALAAYFVYGSSASSNASNAGFSLTLATSFTRYILWWVRRLNDFEVSGSSLERIQEFVVIEQEPAWTESGVPPAYWPASGELRVEGLSAHYSKDGPVGRTGSGKTSLTLALLRCILTEGSVYYDGLPTHSLNLDALRSNVTIIPQSPELLTGTLRQNLDPFDQYDDAILNDALRSAGLFSLQSDMTEGQITLDSKISSGGGNFSVGQRQILALARAIVRGSKLLILDEATSAIDYKTDSVIQTSLRNELGSDVTLITVAHRLQTIMDADRIMVLDAGRIAEFGSPAELLCNEEGRLWALVNESKDKDVLLAMVTGQASDS